MYYAARPQQPAPQPMPAHQYLSPQQPQQLQQLQQPHHQQQQTIQQPRPQAAGPPHYPMMMMHQGPPQQPQQHFTVHAPPSASGTPTHGGGSTGFIPMLPRSAAPTPPAPPMDSMSHGQFGGSSWSISSSALTGVLARSLPTSGAVTPGYTPHGDRLQSGPSQASMCMSSMNNEPWKQFSDSMTSFKVVPGLAQPTLSMSRTTVGSRQQTGGSMTPAASITSQGAPGSVTTPRMVTVVSNGGPTNHNNGKHDAAPGGSIIRIPTSTMSQAPSASENPRAFTPMSRTNSMVSGTTTLAAKANPAATATATATTMVPLSSGSTTSGAVARTPSGSTFMQPVHSRDSSSVVSTPRRIQVVPLSRMATAPSATQPSLAASLGSNASSMVRLVSGVSGVSGGAGTPRGAPAATFAPARATVVSSSTPAATAATAAPLSMLAAAEGSRSNQALEREETGSVMQSLPSFGPSAPDVSAILPEADKGPSAEPSRISAAPSTTTTPRRERPGSAQTGSARAGSVRTRRSSAASLTPRQQRAELAAVERQRVGRERSISARRELLGDSASFMAPPYGPDMGEKSLDTKDGSVIWAGAAAEAALEVSSVTGRRTCSTLQVSADFMAGVCQDRQQQYGGEASTLGTENRAPWHYNAAEERRAASVSRQISVGSASVHGTAHSADLVNSDWKRSLKCLPPPEVVDLGASTPGRRRHSSASTSGHGFSQFSGQSYGHSASGGGSGIGAVLLEDLVLSNRNRRSRARPEQAASASLVEARSAARRRDECSTALFGNTAQECRELSETRRVPSVRSQFLSSGTGSTAVCMMEPDVPRQARSSSARPSREVSDALGSTHICLEDPSLREASRASAPRPRSRLSRGQLSQEVRDAYGCTQVFADGDAARRNANEATRAA